jgi:hypothetical protein
VLVGVVAVSAVVLLVAPSDGRLPNLVVVVRWTLGTAWSNDPAFRMQNTLHRLRGIDFFCVVCHN